MQPVPSQVLEGRNPWWREAWENLTPSQRTAVADAMNLGRRVPSDDLLPFVYGLMAIEGRRLRWVWPYAVLLLAINTVWIYFTCFRHPAPGWQCGMFVATGLLALIAAPLRIAWGRRRLRNAEQANLWGSDETSL